MKMREAIRAAIRDALDEELRLASVGELLTVDDLARIFRVSRSSAYSLGHRIRHVKAPGMHARFAPEDVRAFIEENKRGGPALPRGPAHTKAPELGARVAEIIARRLRKGARSRTPSAAVGAALESVREGAARGPRRRGTPR